jgi:ribosomal protein L11
MTGSQRARTARVSITWREVRDFEPEFDVAPSGEALRPSLKADTPNHRVIVEMIENASVDQLAEIADNSVAAITDLTTERETLSDKDYGREIQLVEITAKPAPGLTERR